MGNLQVIKSGLADVVNSNIRTNASFLPELVAARHSHLENLVGSGCIEQTNRSAKFKRLKSSVNRRYIYLKVNGSPK